MCNTIVQKPSGHGLLKQKSVESITKLLFCRSSIESASSNLTKLTSDCMSTMALTYICGLHVKYVGILDKQTKLHDTVSAVKFQRFVKTLLYLDNLIKCNHVFLHMSMYVHRHATWGHYSCSAAVQAYMNSKLGLARNHNTI